MTDTTTNIDDEDDGEDIHESGLYDARTGRLAPNSGVRSHAKHRKRRRHRRKKLHRGRSGVVFSHPGMVDDWCDEFFANKSFGFGQELIFEKKPIRLPNASVKADKNEQGSLLDLRPTHTGTIGYTLQTSGMAVATQTVMIVMEHLGMVEEFITLVADEIGQWFATLVLDVMPIIGAVSSGIMSGVNIVSLAGCIMDQVALTSTQVLVENDLQTLAEFFKYMKRYITGETAFAASKLVVNGTSTLLQSLSIGFDWSGVSGAAIGLGAAIAKLGVVCTYLYIVWRQMKAANRLLMQSGNRYALKLFKTCPIAACHLFKDVADRQPTSALLDMSVRDVKNFSRTDKEFKKNRKWVEKFSEKTIQPARAVAANRISQSLIQLRDVPAEV